MEIKVNGTPKEIADLVGLVQSRQFSEQEIEITLEPQSLLKAIRDMNATFAVTGTNLKP